MGNLKTELRPGGDRMPRECFWRPTHTQIYIHTCTQSHAHVHKQPMKEAEGTRPREKSFWSFNEMFGNVEVKYFFQISGKKKRKEKL